MREKEIADFFALYRLATFAFLSPDGQLDTRMRITQAGSQVLSLEIALVTFSM